MKKHFILKLLSKTEINFLGVRTWSACMMLIVFLILPCNGWWASDKNLQQNFLRHQCSLCAMVSTRVAVDTPLHLERVLWAQLVGPFTSNRGILIGGM